MDLSNATWRKSSYSGGNCVGIASLPDRSRAVRDSKDPVGAMRFDCELAGLPADRLPRPASRFWTGTCQVGMGTHRGYGQLRRRPGCACPMAR